MKPCVTAAPELWKGAGSDEVLGGGDAFPSRTPRRRGGGGRRQSAAAGALLLKLSIWLP